MFYSNSSHAHAPVLTEIALIRLKTKTSTIIITQLCVNGMVGIFQWGKKSGSFLFKEITVQQFLYVRWGEHLNWYKVYSKIALDHLTELVPL